MDPYAGIYYTHPDSYNPDFETHQSGPKPSAPNDDSARPPPYDPNWATWNQTNQPSK